MDYLEARANNVSAQDQGGHTFCSSCFWDLLESLFAAYYRLADATGFFSTESPYYNTLVEADSWIS
eukprot:363900-Chlamydomonas_euryale.AAC.4